MCFSSESRGVIEVSKVVESAKNAALQQVSNCVGFRGPTSQFNNGLGITAL
jgi:hypothetical protein